MDSAAMNILVCLLMHEHTFLLEICLRVTLLSHRLLVDVSFSPHPFSGSFLCIHKASLEDRNLIKRLIRFRFFSSMGPKMGC